MFPPAQLARSSIQLSRKNSYPESSWETVEYQRFPSNFFGITFCAVGELAENAAAAARQISG